MKIRRDCNEAIMILKIYTNAVRPNHKTKSHIEVRNISVFSAISAFNINIKQMALKPLS